MGRYSDLCVGGSFCHYDDNNNNDDNNDYNDYLYFMKVTHSNPCFDFHCDPQF